MLSSFELAKLQLEYGRPPRGKPEDLTWADSIERMPVHTLTGVSDRPLVQHKGLLTDIVTGSQFDQSGRCLTSWQIALYPIIPPRVVFAPEAKPDDEDESLARAADTPSQRRT